MYQNYIFDLYGTLLDVHTDEYSKNFFKKYAKWLRKQGYSFEWKQFYDWYVKIEKWHRSQPSSHTKPEIQVEDVFREVFAGKKIYLLSNAQRSFIWQELEQTGLVPYFDGILISSDEGCMKPDPDFYNILCDRYQLKKEESVMIGNELKSDMAGAKAVGIDGFYINRYPIFKKEEKTIYKYVAETGSLMDVLEKTGVKEEVRTC